MKVNLDKTKIITFRKGGHRARNEHFYLGNNEIEVVSYYKYLGLVLSCRNVWAKAVQNLANQGNKALNVLSIARKTIGYFHCSTHFKLFDSVILPILSYGSEIWGFQYYDEIERVHRKWCRRLLGVPMHSANEAVVGECGRHPVFVHTIKRCMCFWIRLLEMPPERIPRQAYIMLCNLDALGRHTWATSIKHLLFSYGFGNVWISQEIGNKEQFLLNFMTRVSDVSKQQWQGNIAIKPKLRTYATFKSLLEPEKYLLLTCNVSYIHMFARFRCSSLPLEIEIGRRHGVDSMLRYYRVCRTGEVEDKYHFLLICKKYSNIRKQYLPIDVITEPNIYTAVKNN